MRDLFISECRRFARAAVIFTGAYLLLLLYAFRINFFVLETDGPTQQLILLAHALAGIAFAVAQIGSYRQPNRWLWLLHRPVPRAAIFGGLTLSALIITVLAVGLPLLLNVAAMDWFTVRPVDSRNYLQVPYLVVATYIAWLTGAAVMLNPSRYAFFIVFIAYVLVWQTATAFVALLAILLCAVLMAVVVYGSIQPDRRTPPKGKWAMTIAAIPLVLGFYFVFQWSGSAIYQMGATAIGMHPLNMPAPPKGGYVEAERTDNRSLMLTGLANSTDPRAAHWRRQLALTKVDGFYPRIHSFPVRQQLTNYGMPKGNNPQERIDFRFDHAAMRMKHIDSVTGEARGWSGLGGVGNMQPFPAIPVIMDGYFITPRLALTTDPTSSAFVQRVQLPEGETLISQPKKIGERFYLLSDQRVRVYAADAMRPQAPYIEQYSIKLPGPIYNMMSVSVAPLLDGTLLSITSGSGMVRGVEGGAQTMYFIDADNRALTVAQRTVGNDFPLLWEHRAWLTSPVIHVLESGIGQLFELSGGHDFSIGEDPLRPRPAIVTIFALLLMAASGLAAWLRQRSIKWALACTVLGVPALAALFALKLKPEKDQ